MDAQEQAWPFTCTKEQMDAITRIAVRIEETKDDVEEVCATAGIALDGMDFWKEYVEATYHLQSILKFWGDYEGYVQ